MINRAESATAVSNAWPAKKTIAVSMIANRSARNGAATRPNSTAAVPSWRRAKRMAVPSAAQRARFTNRAMNPIMTNTHRCRSRHRPRLSNSKQVLSNCYGNPLLGRCSGRALLTSNRWSATRANLLGGRRGSTLRKRITAAGLVHTVVKYHIAVAQRETPLADRGAAVGFALNAAIHDHDVRIGALDLDRFLHQHRTGTVEHQDVGHTVALAGDYHCAARL